MLKSTGILRIGPKLGPSILGNPLANHAVPNADQSDFETEGMPIYGALLISTVFAGAPSRTTRDPPNR